MGPDLSERAAAFDVLVSSEAAFVTDPSAIELVRHAAALSRADFVLLRPSTGAPVVRAGSRRDEQRVLALLDADPPTVDNPGLHVVRFEAGASILFCFDPEAADRQRLAAAVGRWVGLRLNQRSVAGESERAAQAELRALRAQISPHFLFNAMSAIAALIRLDPTRAHALLLDFADYTRYSLGLRGAYTSLADELRAIEIYLSLERARFGDRLSVHVTVAPEVLGVAVPFLVLQPLVENAIRHGIEPVPEGGRVTVTAADAGDVVRIVIEDDGAGADPAVIEALLGPLPPTPHTFREHVGLRNIDERLRAVYGDGHGLVIDTAPRAGTKITLSIPKYRPEVMV